MIAKKYGVIRSTKMKYLPLFNYISKFLYQNKEVTLVNVENISILENKKGKTYACISLKNTDQFISGWTLKEIHITVHQEAREHTKNH